MIPRAPGGKRVGWILTVVRRARTALVTLLLAAASACGAPSAPPGPPAVTFTPVALPDDAVPEAIATAGDRLLIGVHRDSGPGAGRAEPPGLLARGPDGTLTAVPALAATGYGRSASWFSLAVDDERVIGVGGDRGGAHGNVRWSVWTGSTTGVAEHAQAFTTFGGWGAGDLTDAVLTPGGMAVVGSWQSDTAGMDVAVWTPNGTDWVRRPSTGTALASTRAALEFATAATGFGAGILVAGWEIATGAGSGQAPVVWTSGPDATGWRKTALPDAGRAGSASAVRCAGSACAVVGRVDGVLALWRLAGGTWSRVSGLPPIPVGDHDRLAAPLDPGGAPVVIAADRAGVSVLTPSATGTTVRSAAGPSGAVVAAAHVGSTVYILAGDPARPRLWRADAAALR